MRLLLETSTAGEVETGSRKSLFDAVSAGSDVALYLESSGYNEFIQFAHFLVGPSEYITGISLVHLGSGIARPRERSGINTVQYLYSSDNETVVCRESLTSGRRNFSSLAQHREYSNWKWYMQRQYTRSTVSTIEALRQYGTQSRMRLRISADVCLVAQSDIVYFPSASSDDSFVVKSSEILLPRDLIERGRERPAEEWRGIGHSDEFCFGYLWIDHRGSGFVAHTPKFKVGHRSKRGARSDLLGSAVAQKLRIGAVAQRLKYFRSKVLPIYSHPTSIVAEIDTMPEVLVPA